MEGDAGAECHDLGVGRDTGHTGAVVRRRSNNARDVGAVARLIHGIAVGEEIVALPRKVRRV